MSAGRRTVGGGLASTGSVGDQESERLLTLLAAFGQQGSTLCGLPSRSRPNLFVRGSVEVGRTIPVT